MTSRPALGRDRRCDPALILIRSHCEIDDHGLPESFGLQNHIQGAGEHPDRSGDQSRSLQAQKNHQAKKESQARDDDVEQEGSVSRAIPGEKPKYRTAARFTAMKAISAPKLRISTDRSHPRVRVPRYARTPAISTL